MIGPASQAAPLRRFSLNAGKRKDFQHQIRMQGDLDLFGPLRDVSTFFWMVCVSDKEAFWLEDPLLVPEPPAKATFMAGSVPSVMQEILHEK